MIRLVDIIPDPTSNRITQYQPATGSSSLGTTISNLIDGRIFPLIYLIIGGLAVIMLVLAGLRYITAAGDPEKAKKARQMFVQVCAGILLIILTAVIAGLIVALVQSSAQGI